MGLARRFRPTDALRACLTGTGVLTAVYGLLAARPEFPDVGWAVAACRKMGWLGLAVWLSFLVCSPRTTGRETSWRLRLGVVVGAGVLGRIFAVLGSPDPVVDVFVWARDAPRVLLQGRNPYTASYPNPYRTARAAALGLNRWAEHKQGYYPPTTTLTGVVPTLLGLDVRHLNAVADGAAALILFLLASEVGRPDVGILCAGIYLCMPRAVRLMEMGYIEPQLAALTGAFVLLAERWKGPAGVLLGLALAAKQSVVLTVLPAARHLVRHPRTLVLAVIAAAALVAPFASWKPGAFAETVIARQMREAPPGSLSVVGALLNLGISVPGWPLWAARLMLLAFITLRTPADEPRTLGLGFAAATLVLLLLNNIAHFNHYYSAVYLVLLGIAGTCGLSAAGDAEMRRWMSDPLQPSRREAEVPLLSRLARAQKIRYFLDPLPKEARILEVGCGDGWVGRYLRANGWAHYCGVDLRPPADVVGDIRQWRTLGMQPASFDAIVAFEVVEHVDCFQELYDLLAPGGVLLLTSPLPRRDWLCKILESLGLTQRRTSPHDHLIDFRDIPLFERPEVRIVGPTAQWGKFRKPRAT